MSPYFSLLADDIEMNVEFVAAVVITGLVVVFIGLILLILFVDVLGKIFTFRKKAASKPKPAAPVPKAEGKKNVIVSSEPSVSQKVPIVEKGISDEVVAVIAAAIAAMSAGSGKKLAIKSIKPSKNQRNPWAAAGLQENTRPF